MHLWALLLYALNIEMLNVRYFECKQCVLQCVHFRTFFFSLLSSYSTLSTHALWFYSVFVSSCVASSLNTLLLAIGRRNEKKKQRTRIVAAIAFWMRKQWLWMSIIHGNNRNNYLFNIHESIEREKKTHNEQSVQI